MLNMMSKAANAVNVINTLDLTIIFERDAKITRPDIVPVMRNVPINDSSKPSADICHQDIAGPKPGEHLNRNRAARVVTNSRFSDICGSSPFNIKDITHRDRKNNTSCPYGINPQPMHIIAYPIPCFIKVKLGAAVSTGLIEDINVAINAKIGQISSNANTWAMDR